MMCLFAVPLATLSMVLITKQKISEKCIGKVLSGRTGATTLATSSRA
jgi:hypothetical protein